MKGMKKRRNKKGLALPDITSYKALIVTRLLLVHEE